MLKRKNGADADMDGVKSWIILGVLVDVAIMSLLAIDVYLSYENLQRNK